MSLLLGQALGSYVISPIVEFVDFDGVMRRIDVEAVLDRIDFNHHLQRIDWDALLERINVDQLVERTNIGDIVARSSSGVCMHVMDAFRTQIVRFDQTVQRIGRLACFQEAPLLPPGPGKLRNSRQRPCPRDAALLAVEMQGRYAGVFARFIAFLMDVFILGIVFGFCVLLVQTIRFTINPETFLGNQQTVVRSCIDDSKWVVALFFGMGFFYSYGCLVFTGRTVGQAICGLLIVNAGDGSRLCIVRTALHLLLAFLSVFSIVGVLLGWVRKDSRMLHNWLACTGVVFSWDARLARLRARDEVEAILIVSSLDPLDDDKNNNDDDSGSDDDEGSFERQQELTMHTPLDVPYGEDRSTGLRRKSRR